MWKQMAPAIRLLLFFTILTGLIYPGVITLLCHVFFRGQANGSLISVNGRVVGSSLIGQKFTEPQYFHARPSAAGTGYDASASNGSNYGPTSRALVDRVKASLVQFRKENPHFTGPIPADVVTASASGLDPDISPASAYAQARRVAATRHISLRRVRRLIRMHTRGRQFGFLGEPRVNVLELNLALDDH
jgi:potassium-transporting ATPase KdpC subunit